MTPPKNLLISCDYAATSTSLLLVIYSGTIFILRKGVLAFFRPPTYPAVRNSKYIFRHTPPKYYVRFLKTTYPLEKSQTNVIVLEYVKLQCSHLYSLII